MSRNPDPITPTPSSVEIAEPRETRPAPSGTRRTSEAPIAEPWRDVLLRLSTALPIDVASEDLGRIFLDGVSLLFPGSALGICIVQAGRAEPVVVHRRQIERQPRQLRRTAHHVAAGDFDRRSGLRHPAAGAQRSEIPAGGRHIERGGLQRHIRWIDIALRLGSDRAPRWQHCPAMEVEHRPPFLVQRPYVQHGNAARRPVRFRWLSRHLH